MRKPLSLSVGLLLALILSGCAEKPQPAPRHESPLAAKVGTGCVVQFRRDALGAASANGIPPTTTSINGSPTSIGGMLRQVDDDWIVVEELGGGTEFVIAVDAILMVQFQHAKKVE